MRTFKRTERGINYTYTYKNQSQIERLSNREEKRSERRYFLVGVQRKIYFRIKWIWQRERAPIDERIIRGGGGGAFSRQKPKEVQIHKPALLHKSLLSLIHRIRSREKIHRQFQRISLFITEHSLASQARELHKLGKRAYSSSSGAG